MHSHLLSSSVQLTVPLQTALLNMYATCGSLAHATSIFNALRQNGQLDVVAWTAMIHAYTLNCQHEKALELFEQMKHSNVKPNSQTYCAVLSACSDINAIVTTFKIHKEVIQNGTQSIAVNNALIHTAEDRVELGDQPASVWTRLTQLLIVVAMSTLSGSQYLTTSQYLPASSLWRAHLDDFNDYSAASSLIISTPKKLSFGPSVSAVGLCDVPYFKTKRIILY